DAAFALHGPRRAGCAAGRAAAAAGPGGSPRRSLVRQPPADRRPGARDRRAAHPTGRHPGRGRLMATMDDLRAGVRKSFPGLAEIGDGELRAKVVEAWAL